MADHESGTVIGADTSIKGEMTVENRARILGKFEGTIHAKGQVEVADKAVCKATVEAGTVQIDGRVEGDVTAVEKAHLNATAAVVGDMVASRLVVSEGAAFQGHLHVGPDAVKGKSGRPAPAPAAPRKEKEKDEPGEPPAQQKK